MKACWCVLAGTRACESCSNAPSRTLFDSQIILLGKPDKIPDKLTFWTNSLSDVNAKTEDRKSK